MRSMLDHVQVPDLAIIEARRVLKSDGSLLIGLYVEGGKESQMKFGDLIKHEVKEFLGNIGISRYKDHHTWHPTFRNLKKILTDNGFTIDKVYWQPYWNDKVVYIKAMKV